MTRILDLPKDPQEQRKAIELLALVPVNDEAACTGEDNCLCGICPPQAFDPISDFYDDETERRHRKPVQPFEWTEAEIEAANRIIEASFLESQVSVALDDPRRCPTCSGFAEVNLYGTGLVSCPTCKGKGRSDAI